MLKEPQRIQGYQDMGPSLIPPMPPGIVMEDRDDGVLYLLSHDSGADTYELTSTIPALYQGVPFSPYEGPLLQHPNGWLRLYVTGGILAYEEAPAAFTGALYGRIFTRKFEESGVVYELTAPAGWVYGDPLTVTQVIP